MKYLSMLKMILISSVLLFIVACGADNDAPKGNNEEAENDLVLISDEDQDPITLRMAVPFDESMFNDRFKDPIEEKFEHITMEYVDLFTYYQPDIEEFFMSGETADIFFTMFQEAIEDLEMDQDLTPLLEKYKISTEHVNQVLLDSIRAQDPEGRLVSWPYEDTYIALLYNKEIFDMFGEPYPGDDMTWEEAMKLADKLTREQNGVQYRGLDFEDDVMLSQLSVNATDPETGEVLLVKEPAFKKYLDMFDRYFNIHGMELEEGDLLTDSRFVGDQTTAMLITNAQALTWYEEVGGLDYDLAPVPTWEDLPGVGPRGFLQTLTINPTTEHQDTIIQLFDYFASDEYQAWMAAQGIGIISDSQTVLDDFYKNYEYTHDKNVKAIFHNTPAPPPEKISRWDEFAEIKIEEYSESGMDANEYLRVLSEEAETKIEEKKTTK